jgi:hypothetical protein
MKILFAIAVLSFAALVWAALAIMRHVRKNSARAASPPVAELEMAEAIENRLSQVTRPASRHQRAELSAEVQEDFSYLHRDTASSRSEKQPFADVPIKPAVIDRH